MKDWAHRPTEEDEFNENLLTDDELNNSQKVKPMLMQRIRKNNKGSLSPTIEQKDEDEELEKNYQNIVRTDPRTLNKIMNYAKDFPSRFQENSPDNDRTLDVPYEKYNTLTEP